jgi:putative acetyltransferase
MARNCIISDRRAWPRNLEILKLPLAQDQALGFENNAHRRSLCSRGAAMKHQSPVITVRPMRSDEGHTFFDIHTKAIHGLAAKHYPLDVIQAWAGTATDERVRHFMKNADGEIRLIADLDGEPVGLGVLVVEHSELRACYVVPEAARKGVGSAIVREIERLAKQEGLNRLELRASINAEGFYHSLGYESLGDTEHTLRSGVRMKAVKMVKALR